MPIITIAQLANEAQMPIEHEWVIQIGHPIDALVLAIGALVRGRVCPPAVFGQLVHEVAPHARWSRRGIGDRWGRFQRERYHGSGWRWPQDEWRRFFCGLSKGLSGTLAHRCLIQSVF